MSSKVPVLSQHPPTTGEDLQSTGSKQNRSGILPPARLERVPAWGEASHAMSYVYRPSNSDGLRKVLATADEGDYTIGARGAGNSYGDATLNEGNITLDMSRMNRILEWEPEIGRITIEPGVTISQLWQYILEDGWWPAVIPGTSNPTVGGCAGMNIHGKNAWRQGTIGDHIEEFDLMLPSGEIISCSRENNRELFFGAIGSFGMLGIFTSLTLRLKRIYSGYLEVHALASRNLREMMDQFDAHLDDSDYLVGWIDAYAGGSSLGRGQIHRANYLVNGVDPNPQQSMRLDHQHLPDTLFLFVPRSIMWRLMRPFMNKLGTRLVNMGKYWTSRWSHDSKFLQPHVAFHFLLDYVPNWKRSYGSGGLIQYQCFVPEEAAHDAFSEILMHCQKRGLVNFLTVLKKHRTDEFLISHGVDGYSLAMDFRVKIGKRERLAMLAKELDEIVLQAGGRFYLAKDSTLRPEVVEAYLGQEVINKFHSLKNEYDPGAILQTNLWRRLFAQQP